MNSQLSYKKETKLYSMNLKGSRIYHFYNRGNNKQTIFFCRENYLLFLRKSRKYLKPHVEILTYCLMPNHFHFLIFAKNDIISEDFSEDIRIMLSSYTKGINNQENRTGSLFQQNSKAKNIDDSILLQNVCRCFHYIHQNPLSAKLVTKMEHWEFSSFRDYIGLRNGTLCNKKLAYKYLNLPQNHKEFYEHSYQSIDPKKITEFYQ